MNSVIISRVTLGSKMIVAIGSIVTQGFPRGHCLTAGSSTILTRNYADGAPIINELDR